MYNATRLTELRQFAHEQGLTVLWQNLFGPVCLDPTKHNQAVAQLAAEEIEKFYATGLATDSERVFFDTLLQQYRANTNITSAQTQEFAKHIHDIENKYHTDQTGQFEKLWPEIYKLIQHE
jgi:hypothetical protein